MAFVVRTRTGYAVRWREHGKERYEAVRGTHKDALKIARDKERRAALGHLYEEEPETLAHFLVGFWERVEADVRPSTFKLYQQGLDALELDEDVYLCNLRPTQVGNAVAKAAKRAPRLAQIGLMVLKKALNEAVADGQRVNEAIFKVSRPRYQERETHFLDWPQVEALASWMPESVRRIVPIAALTGLRQGELLELREYDLDLDKMCLRVRTGKTAAAARTVRLPANAVELLREQLLARKHTSDRLVFPAPEGGKWGKDNFGTRVFRPAREHAGLDVTFHDLRRSYVALMIRAGVDVRTIAEQLGHADKGALLLKRYGSLYADAGERAAQSLQRLLDNERKQADSTSEESPGA